MGVLNSADNNDLNSEPPPISFSSQRALSLSVDTQPMYVPVGESDLQFVINTNWDAQLGARHQNPAKVLDSLQSTDTAFQQF